MKLQIQQGVLGQEERHHAATLLRQGFSHHLALLGASSQATRALLERALQVQRGFYALALKAPPGEQLMGLAGLDSHRGPFLHFSFWSLCRCLPLSTALLASFALNRPPSSRLAPGEASLVALAVQKEVRRQGVARALLQQIEQYAINQGLSLLSLEMDPHNSPALALYQKEGFSLQPPPLERSPILCEALPHSPWRLEKKLAPEKTP
jgi:ribosomal protein S18 acetylase RimI-like enzyme